MARPTANATASKVTKVSVDFSNTDDRKGGRSAHVPPGDYLLEVIDAEVVGVKSDPTGRKRQIQWISRIKAGEAGIGELLYYYTTLDETTKGGLWKLRNLLSDLAGGQEIPKSKANLDLSTKIGKTFGATLIDDEPYERANDDGSTTVIERSTISLTFPADRFVGAVPASAPAAAAPAATAAAKPAAPAKNGTAKSAAAEVADAIAQPDEEDADIAPLPVADL